MTNNRSQLVGAAFGAYCKLNDTERAEFDAMVKAVEIHQRAQTQQNAGTKAAATRKQRRQPPVAASAAIGGTGE